ncbi:hypothetical protein FRC01_005348 [Tulasnella sp. 417]|nr:hypothetical protein FRC01_005348 [Tulasnella sp. 417]
MLWQARNEWDEIRSVSRRPPKFTEFIKSVVLEVNVAVQQQDLSFRIRVPESIPPSLALERDAGIKYELVATVLARGKKTLLQRETTQTVTTSCQIIIDKHELHSAWPMYSRPASMSKMLDGYTLTVNRAWQAYGPGDRISVQTFVKNDTPQVNHVRFYQFSLRELVTDIVEQRIPITMASPVHPGVEATAELSLLVPVNQTTTTVSFANRIEVEFEIHVRVVLATGMPLFLDLLITMSNWTRTQSIQAVRQIGPAGTLSNPGGVPNPVAILPAWFEQYSMGSPLQSNPQPPMGWPSKSGAEPTYLDSWQWTAGSPYNGITPFSSGDLMGDWAAKKLSIEGTTSSFPQPHSVYGHEFSPMLGGSIHPSVTSASGFTSQASLWRRQLNIPPLPPAKIGQSASGISGAPARLSKWLGATEGGPPRQQQEFFEAARLWPEGFQWVATHEADDSASLALQEKASFASPISPPVFKGSTSYQSPAHRDTSPPPPPFTYTSSSPPAGEWPSAAEEKEQARRFREAQEAAERSQRFSSILAPPTPIWPSANGPHVWTPESPNNPDPGASTLGIPARMALYQSPIESVLQPTMGTGPANGGPGYHPYTADDKEVLIYKRAMELANRTQADAFGNESAVQHKALSPSGPSGPSGRPIAPILPPKLTRDLSPNRERNACVDPTPPSPSPPGMRPLDAREEKERMRQMYGAQDTVAWRLGGATLNEAPIVPPPHGPLNGSSKPDCRIHESPPSPPAASNSQPLAATQEKAMLQARYAAENAAQSRLGTPPLPPPTRSGNAWSRRPLPTPQVDLHQPSSRPDLALSGR